MKKLLFIGAVFTFVTTFAFAGPNISSGPQATENLVSKQKIKAVLEAITGVNDVVESVSLDAGKVLYVVSVRNGQACQESYYKVTPVKNGLAEYTAQFVDLISAGPCQ